MQSIHSAGNIQGIKGMNNIYRVYCERIYKRALYTHVKKMRRGSREARHRESRGSTLELAKTSKQPIIVPRYNG